MLWLALPNVLIVSYGIAKCIREIVSNKGEVQCAVV